MDLHLNSHLPKYLNIKSIMIMDAKKKTNWGQLSILLSIIAVVFTVIRWGNVGSFGMPLCSSLGAIVAGIIALVKKDGGNRASAIFGIILSVPALLISLWKLYNFINIMY